MSKYIIDFEAWTTLEADNAEDAFDKAQHIIMEIEELVANHMALEEPLLIVVRENGVTEEEEEE